MPLYTTDYLRTLAKSESLRINEAKRSESLRSRTSFDIFLAHSLNDRNDVYGLYVELTNQGFSVYVDWIVDPHLDRDNVTKTSAEVIRGRLRSSKSLLLAMSTNAVVSKWVPWELGWVDGHVNRCALVPVADGRLAPASFQRREYFLLYPYIMRGQGLTQPQGLLLVESSNTYVPAKSWVEHGVQPSYQTVSLF